MYKQLKNPSIEQETPKAYQVECEVTVRKEGGRSTVGRHKLWFPRSCCEVRGGGTVWATEFIIQQKEEALADEGGFAYVEVMLR